MGQTTEILTSAIDRWHLSAATGVKDTNALRSSLLALAAHIDGPHIKISSADRVQLQSKLASVANVVSPPKPVAMGLSTASSGGDHGAPADTGEGHVSVFA